MGLSDRKEKLPAFERSPRTSLVQPFRVELLHGLEGRIFLYLKLLPPKLLIHLIVNPPEPTGKSASCGRHRISLYILTEALATIFARKHVW